MSYIIKKNEPLVNLKLTDTGRRNLSSGSLTFTSFSLGDGEMDYSSDNFQKVNILISGTESKLTIPVLPNSRITVFNLIK